MLKRVFILIILVVLSLGLAWISSDFGSLQGWVSYLAVSGLGAGLIWLCWLATQRESPQRWLLWLVIGAAFLRLLLGFFWTIALPQWGYGGEAEMAGYVMSDAYKRDTAAFEFSRLDFPWRASFGGYRSVDQYGGLLFLSAGIYRFLGGATHKPILMLILTASFSSLGIFFTWAFVKRLWDQPTARFAAWTLALYPEAVLLGSSQMREAFTVPLAAVAIYGLIFLLQERDWNGGAWVAGALLLSIPLSPPFTMILAGTLLLITFFMKRTYWLRDWRLWAALGGVILVGVAGLWFFGAQISEGENISPIAILQHWIERTRIYETVISQASSGWMHKVFEGTPDHIYSWFILAYGVLQPFLPAALIANGNWLWRLIAIWRALGWTFILPFLIYAPIRAVRCAPILRQWIVVGSSAAIWVSILVSSYRSGGDLWDNPRYRVSLACLQIATVAWVWVDQQRRPDPWLKRFLISAGFVLLWFIPWYLRRYTPLEWDVIDVFKTIGLGIANAVLYWIWDWARSYKGDTLT